MINWSQFTVDNGAIKDLRELMFTSTFDDPDIETVVTKKPGVEDGKKLGYVDKMQDVGRKGTGCEPVYESVSITGVEKTWDLGEWEVPLKLCYKEIEDTIGKSGLKTGTDKADLQDTPYWDIVLIPLLKQALNNMYWRLIFFGDTAAQNVASGGVITDGIATNLFTANDGIWKRLFALCTANASQRTAVTANSGDTIDAQKQAVKVSGYAVQLFDDFLSDADSRIFDDKKACVMCTNSLFKALRNDLVDKYGKYTMTVKQVAAGIKISEYDGVPLIVLDIWDRMIKKYEQITTTTQVEGQDVTKTRLNLPHRAVVCSPNNLFVGTEDEDTIASLSIKFDDTTKLNHIYASSTLGTLLGEDALFQVAY